MSLQRYEKYLIKKQQARHFDLRCKYSYKKAKYINE